MANVDICIRPAEESDIGFLVRAIISAEKSGTDRLSYSTLFGVPEDDLVQMLGEVLAEDVPGQELCVSGFLIATHNNQPVGAICAWVEGVGSKASTLVKGSVIMFFMGRERIEAAAPDLKLIEAISLPRAAGALQLESVHVEQAFRGQGVVVALIAEHLKRARRNHPGIEKAQIILAANNNRATQAYIKAGFRVTQQRSSDQPRVAALLPSPVKVLMERSLIDY